MFEKGKKYTYEEIEEILKNAQVEALATAKKEFREAAVREGKQLNPLAELAYDMQNIMFSGVLFHYLLGGNKNV